MTINEEQSKGQNCTKPDMKRLHIFFSELVVEVPDDWENCGLGLIDISGEILSFLIAKP